MKCATTEQKTHLRDVILEFMKEKELVQPNLSELFLELTYDGYFYHIGNYIGVLFEVFSLVANVTAGTEPFPPSKNLELNGANALGAIGKFLNSINTPDFEAYLNILKTHSDNDLPLGEHENLLTKYTLK